jgi:hypothetical protein
MVFLINNEFANKTQIKTGGLRIIIILRCGFVTGVDVEMLYKI